MLDLIYSRYSNPKEFMELEATTGYNMLITAFNSQEEDRLYQMYVSVFPHMDPEHRISFEELKAQATRSAQGTTAAKENKGNKANKSKEEIMLDVERVINKARGGEDY